MPVMTRIVAALIASLLAACATPASMGGRLEAELRAAVATQTYGTEILPDGTVGSVRRALNDDTIQRIVAGMTWEEILRLVGPPRDVMEFPRKREISWEYHFVDTWGYRSYLYVNFDPAGIVVGRFTRRHDPSRGNHD